MNALVLNDPLTLGALLYPSEEDPAEAISRALEESGVVTSLTGALSELSIAGRRASIHELAGVTADLVDLPVVQVLAMGWQKYDTLMQAARRTAGSSLVEVVDLAIHRITSVHRPYVDILVDDAPIATVHFELRLELLVKALVVSVRGRLVAFHSGDTDVMAALSAEGVELSRIQRHVSLPLEVALDRGIPLLEAPSS